MNHQPTSCSLNHRAITVSREWRRFKSLLMVIFVGIVAGFLDPFGILFPAWDMLSDYEK